MKKFNPNKNIIITLIIVILVVSVLSVTIARRAVGNSSSFVQSASQRHDWYRGQR